MSSSTLWSVCVGRSEERKQQRRGMARTVDILHWSHNRDAAASRVGGGFRGAQAGVNKCDHKPSKICRKRAHVDLAEGGDDRRIRPVEEREEEVDGEPEELRAAHAGEAAERRLGPAAAACAAEPAAGGLRGARLRSQDRRGEEGVS